MRMSATNQVLLSVYSLTVCREESSSWTYASARPAWSASTKMAKRLIAPSLSRFPSVAPKAYPIVMMLGQPSEKIGGQQTGIRGEDLAYPVSRVVGSSQFPASASVMPGESVGDSTAAASALASASPSCGPREVTRAEEAKALFLYGTLMHKKVLEGLLGRMPQTRKARLSNYHRYRIQGFDYPGVRPKDGSSVDGLFMPGLDEMEKTIFDIFEDKDYYKEDVSVVVDGFSEPQLAMVYVWDAALEDQLYSTWEPSVHFAPDSDVVERYVSMIEGCSEEIRQEALAELERRRETERVV